MSDWQKFLKKYSGHGLTVGQLAQVYKATQKTSKKSSLRVSAGGRRKSRARGSCKSSHDCLAPLVCSKQKRCRAARPAGGSRKRGSRVVSLSRKPHRHEIVIKVRRGTSSKRVSPKRVSLTLASQRSSPKKATTTTSRMLIPYKPLSRSTTAMIPRPMVAQGRVPTYLLE